MASYEQFPSQAGQTETEPEIELVELKTEHGTFVQTSEDEAVLKKRLEMLGESDPSSDYEILPFGVLVEADEHDPSKFEKKAGFSLWKREKTQ